MELTKTQIKQISNFIALNIKDVKNFIEQNRTNYQTWLFQEELQKTKQSLVNSIIITGVIIKQSKIIRI